MQNRYKAPDFSQPRFTNAPDARFVPVKKDGVLPKGFFSTTNLPTYVKSGGEWFLPDQPRMDSVIVLRRKGDDGLPSPIQLIVLEGRNVRSGDYVAVGTAEDASEGIFVHADGFAAAVGEEGFAFMGSEVSREKPVDYEAMAENLLWQRANGGHVVWVLGPAVLHSRGRDAIVWFIENGFVGALLGGNAVAVHDIEQALLGTTLGMARSGRPVAGGHAFHMRAINRIREAGSIAAAVRSGVLTEGIMHACVTKGVPFVLAGSIRDDGPLPDTIADALEAQRQMREHAKSCTLAVMIASALHGIAFGNMLPAYTTRFAGVPSELQAIAVDSSEFVVNKLKDRGTHQAFGVITNAQDFLAVLKSTVATMM